VPLRGFIDGVAKGLLMKIVKYRLQREASSVAEFSVSMATTILTRARGLLFRTALGNDQAMLIAPCNSVHTCFMGYRLDVVFLDKERKIMKIIESVKPWRFATHFKAKQVIEFKAGVVAQTGMAVGDVFSES